MRLDNLYVQDNRLFLGAAAPTEEIRYDIWNAIKAINPVLDDIVAEIAVDSSLPAPPAAQRYAIKPGDTLSEISLGFLRGVLPRYMKSRGPKNTEGSSWRSASAGRQRATAPGGAVRDTLTEPRRPPRCPRLPTGPRRSTLSCGNVVRQHGPSVADQVGLSQSRDEEREHTGSVE